MLDVFNTPSLYGKGDVWSTVANGGADAITRVLYTVPRGKSMLHIYLSGGGGGGGGGRTGAAASARGGGGGAGSGAIATLQIPVELCPPVLEVLVGRPGPGGAANSNGVAGGASAIYYSVKATNPANNIFLLVNGGEFGFAGTAVAAGVFGAGGAVVAATAMNMVGLGIFQTFAGQNGASGGVHTGANGGNTPIPTNGANTMGGTGGGGTTSADFTGGDITLVTSSLISQYVGLNSGAAGNGGGGLIVPQPFWSTPGMGGGASNTGVGGQGGNGGPGSGGGGGGGGTTGGTGGDGGGGVCVIIAT